MSLKLNLDIDLTRFPYIIYLFIIFAVSRFPFLNLGFSAFTSSTDLDVLSVVNSAYLFHYAHTYTVSRFPGFPFFEMFNSLLIAGGWVLTNTATAIVSFITLILFGKVLNIFEIKNKALLLLTFAFIPIIWINSTITMDYMWALMFILLACIFGFTGRYSLAGISIGLAIGTRFTSLFMAMPLIYWMLIKKVDSKNIKKFILSGFFSSMVMFFPVLYRYHLEFFRGSGFIATTPVKKPLESLAGSIMLSSINLITELTGLVVFVLILILILLYRRPIPALKTDHLLNFCWTVIIIYGVIYYIFPYKVAYLIPIIPWGMIILNEKLHKNYLVIVCILLLLNNIVSVNIEHDNQYKLGIDSGNLLKNYQDRKLSGINQSEEYLESLSATLKKETIKKEIKSGE